LIKPGIVSLLYPALNRKNLRQDSRQQGNGTDINMNFKSKSIQHFYSNYSQKKLKKEGRSLEPSFELAFKNLFSYAIKVDPKSVDILKKSDESLQHAGNTNVIYCFCGTYILI
jgi:hypothetical protein